MAEERSTSAYGDMLDIIFADRNKAYGAYQLRRAYAKYVGRALAIGLLLIALFFALPYIMNAVAGAMKEKPVDVTAELGPPPDIDPNNPPPPPPPPPPTPPPPTRTTVAFVPPVIKKDIEVQEEEPPKTVEELEETKADIGADTKQGNDDAAPTIDENPSELAVVEEVKPEPEKEFQLFDVQKQPSFPGGEKEMFKFIQENLKYPPLARENNIQGRVAVSFVVNKDGSIGDVSILKDIGGGCGKEAARIVGSMPKWIPGEANGHPVKVRYTLPVQFKLE